MLVLMTIGAGVVPLLSLQHTPIERSQNVSVSFTWPNASAKVIEQEVTSKIEGLLAGIRGVQRITSSSSKGRGVVSLAFKKGVDMGAVRFEISSLIRQVYPKLPDGVSYPLISLSTMGDRPQAILVYTFNADLSPMEIQRYVERHIISKLSRIEGVNSANLTGANSFYYEVAYNPDKMRAYGIMAADIQSALQQRYGAERVLGSVVVEAAENAEASGQQVLVKLESGGQLTDFEQILIKTVAGRHIYLREIAQVSYKEEKPSFYFRVNGLNTINMTVYPERGVNTLTLVRQIKEVMRQIEREYPPNFTSLLRSDSSKNIVKELNKIFYRTALSVLILLTFVFVMTRSLRYLGITALTLLANVLISFIFFYLFKVDIHIYSMAGVTVSLGMVIDASIIMIDHYGYHRNKKAFYSVMTAMLTTVGALIIVFFLPERTKLMLLDFSKVIIINLLVSLVIAWFFVPVLVDRFPIRGVSRQTSPRSLARRFRWKKRQVAFSRRYEGFILFSRRWRWALLLAGILGFGLPIQFLPTSLKDEKGKAKEQGLAGTYNKTIGGEWYQSKGKAVLEPALGGTLRLFTKNKSSFGYRDPSRLSIFIRAHMPEGSTVEQMNAVMRSMENYISQYDEVDMFETSVQARSATMTVTFKKQYEHSSFPLQLREEIIYQAIRFGAATWTITGIVEQSFNNNLFAGEFYGHQILFTGYNYDKLFELASATADRLRQNRRVSRALVYSTDAFSRAESGHEYYIHYNQERIAYNQWSLRNYYNYLRQQLLDIPAAVVYEEGNRVEIKLVSDQKDAFDVWHVEHDLLDIHGRQMKLSELGTIDRRRTGNNIYKENQQYHLRLGFDFVGTHTLATRLLNDELDALKASLPVGYKAQRPDFGGWWNASDSKQYWLLFLIIVVIYFMCSILFESLRQPFVIISLIPLSFIGVFLVFYLFGFYFDQGGFASMILLCGIVVNSGIYFINEYNLTVRGRPDASGDLFPMAGFNRKKAVRMYVKAFNHKIMPVSLTILSTILGLIPFLLEGPKEVFWFPFAVGAMGGMLFSFVVLFVYLPAFLPIDKHIIKS